MNHDSVRRCVRLSPGGPSVMPYFLKSIHPKFRRMANGHEVIRRRAAYFCVKGLFSFFIDFCLHRNINERHGHSTNRDRKNMWGGGHWANNIWSLKVWSLKKCPYNHRKAKFWNIKKIMGRAVDIKWRLEQHSLLYPYFNWRIGANPPNGRRC